MENIIGRDEELKILDSVYSSEAAELVAIYGRRRVGKTFLIRQYFKPKSLYFELTGNKDATPEENLYYFSVELGDTFYRGEAQPTPKTWPEAFQALRKAINQVTHQEKIVLFFDEVPWLASGNSGFLAALDHFWNRYLSSANNIIVVVCGSAASWVIDNIINDKGGLHGRITRQIRLLPFSLSETERFLHSQHVELNRKQIVELYLAFGGVAKYLAQVTPGLSAQQLISHICFSPHGLLFSEFNKLYRSLFKNYEVHIALIKALAENHGGVDRKTLLQRVDLSSGGRASKVFNELEESGFIASIPVMGDKKGEIYRLIDEYSLFYLKWIETAPNFSLKGVDKSYWQNQYHSQSWLSWAGFAFEGICLKHIEKIKTALGISGVNTREYFWQHKGSDDTTGAQIDLVIDRTDDCINLCEIKFHKSELILSKQDASKLNYKKELFRQITKSKKALFTTLITTYGAKRNPAYLSSVDQEVTLDALF